MKLWHLFGMAILLTTAMGCASLQRVDQPAQFIEREHPAEVHVTFLNNSRVTVMRPRVAGDSLVGRIAGVSQLVAAPLAHIERIEARQRDPRRTRWMVAGLGLAAVGLVFGITRAGTNDWRHPCEELGSSDCDYREY